MSFISKDHSWEWLKNRIKFSSALSSFRLSTGATLFARHTGFCNLCGTGDFFVESSIGRWLLKLPFSTAYCRTATCSCSWKPYSHHCSASESSQFCEGQHSLRLLDVRRKLNMDFQSTQVPLSLNGA